LYESTGNGFVLTACLHVSWAKVKALGRALMFEFLVQVNQDNHETTAGLGR
jgi:hypothetical protein